MTDHGGFGSLRGVSFVLSNDLRMSKGFPEGSVEVISVYIMNMLGDK